jgi:hypothetical protein
MSDGRKAPLLSLKFPYLDDYELYYTQALSEFLN